ncbi:unnamed protein product [Prorocentrum cordatum]|uniref:Uncharacterized protein n=1 Tax=Prorocentrum cordatum TaxID=2364126 RepID=A0ABN9WXN2_9DINO|nr:unnamed protein product [Polarella glacialis]
MIIAATPLLPEALRAPARAEGEQMDPAAARDALMRAVVCCDEDAALEALAAGAGVGHKEPVAAPPPHPRPEIPANWRPGLVRCLQSFSHAHIDVSLGTLRYVLKARWHIHNAQRRDLEGTSEHSVQGLAARWHTSTSGVPRLIHVDP